MPVVAVQDVDINAEVRRREERKRLVDQDYPILRIFGNIIEAIDEVENSTDEYEKTWQKYTHQVLARPWRDVNVLEGD